VILHQGDRPALPLELAGGQTLDQVRADLPEVDRLQAGHPMARRSHRAEKLLTLFRRTEQDPHLGLTLVLQDVTQLIHVRPPADDPLHRASQQVMAPQVGAVAIRRPGGESERLAEVRPIEQAVSQQAHHHVRHRLVGPAGHHQLGVQIDGTVAHRELQPHLHGP
jgi:hypothetical protein